MHNERRTENDTSSETNLVPHVTCYMAMNMTFMRIQDITLLLWLSGLSVLVLETAAMHSATDRALVNLDCCTYYDSKITAKVPK